MGFRQDHFVQVESKNAVLELLKADVPFERIYIATNAFRDPKTKEILGEARTRKIPVEKITRKRIRVMARTASCESVIGLKPTQNMVTLEEILEGSRTRNKPLFILMLDNIMYSQNLGAILRTAYGAGVDAVITAKRKSRFLTEDVTRISMGASERIPIVQMNLFDALKKLKDAGIQIIGVHMTGQTYYKKKLSGNLAFVLGSEDSGVSPRILEKCDSLVSIPMKEGLASLNVSVSAAVLMYEKHRQDSQKPQ